jgi:SET domain
VCHTPRDEKLITRKRPDEDKGKEVGRIIDHAITPCTVDNTVNVMRQKKSNIQNSMKLQRHTTRRAADPTTSAMLQLATCMFIVSPHVLLLQILLSLPTACSLSFSASSSTSNRAAVDRPALSSGCLAYSSIMECDFVEIATAEGAKGLGAFATRPIKLGDYIGQYFGEILSLQEVNARYFGKAIPSTNDQRWRASRNARCQGLTGHYVFEMKSGDFVDAEDGDRSSWCRFMNHAEEDTRECNVKAFDKLTIGGDLLLYPQFFAMRDIQKGEELCYFYGVNSHCTI